jgi:hypothetical protein
MKATISIIKTTLLIASIFVLGSCEDKVQLKLDNKTNRIAVDAFLNNLRGTQKIRLTSTDNYFSGQTPPPVAGAEISVTDLTINRKYVFADQHDGNYTYSLSSSDTIVFQGHTYELSVRYHNYQYHSITIARRSAKIERLFFQYEQASTGLMGTTAEGNKVKMLAKDPTGPDPDFYWIKLYKNGKFYGQPQNMQLENFGLNNESDGQYFNPERWKATGPEGEEVCYSGDNVRIEILGISRETYDFLSLGVKMSSNGGMFAVTPVNLPTNIHHKDQETPDAVGFFSVSEVNYQEIVIP